MSRAALLLAVVFAAAAGDAEPAAPVPPRHVDRAPAGPSVEARLAEIQRRVQAAVRYPESARMRGISGEARVAFEVRPDGTPDGVAVVESSGSAVLDRAAERAVRTAGGLPRVIGRVHVPVRFALVSAD